MKCLLLLVILCSTIAFADNFKIATLNWQPYIGQELLMNGPVAEVLTRAFKSQGHQASLHFFPWARALSSSKIDSYDGLIPEYLSPERAIEYTLIDLSIESPLVLCKRRSMKLVTPFTGNLTQLSAYRIGVVRGYINTEEFDNADYLTKDEAVDDYNNMEKLFKKRVDLIAIDKNVAMNLTKTRFLDTSQQIDCLSPPLSLNKLYLAVYKKNKRHDEIVKIAIKGIKAIKTEIPFIRKRYNLN